jgi:hypothetical protein
MFPALPSKEVGCQLLVVSRGFMLSVELKSWAEGFSELQVIAGH